MQGIVVLWPDEGNYARFREISDGIKAPTLQAYRARIAADLDSKARAGFKIDKVAFDIDDLEAFARRRGLDRIGSRERAEFALVAKAKRDSA